MDQCLARLLVRQPALEQDPRVKRLQAQQVAGAAASRRCRQPIGRAAAAHDSMFLSYCIIQGSRVGYAWGSVRTALKPLLVLLLQANSQEVLQALNELVCNPALTLHVAHSFRPCLLRLVSALVELHVHGGSGTTRAASAAASGHGAAVALTTEAFSAALVLMLEVAPHLDRWELVPKNRGAAMNTAAMCKFVSAIARRCDPCM